MNSHNTMRTSEILADILYYLDIEMVRKDNKVILSFTAMKKNILVIEMLADNHPYDLSKFHISFTFEHKRISVVTQDIENYDYKKLLSDHSCFSNKVIGIVEKYILIATGYMKKFNNDKNKNILSFLNETQVGDILLKDKSLIWPITNEAYIELRINKQDAIVIGFLNGYKAYSDLVDMGLLSDPKYDGRQILQSIIILMVYKIYKKDLPNVDKNVIEDIISGIIEDFEVLEV